MAEGRVRGDLGRVSSDCRSARRHLCSLEGDLAAATLGPAPSARFGGSVARKGVDDHGAPIFSSHCQAGT